MSSSREKKSKDLESRYEMVGCPDNNGCDNSITTSRYTIFTFLPIAIGEQFRKYGNIYFLGQSILMRIGDRTELFETAFTSLTSSVPLMIVVAFSLMQEGSTDLERHRSDAETNSFPCLVLKNAGEVEPEEKVDMLNNLGDNSETKKLIAADKVSFSTVRRADMHPGHLVMVRNREMIPADIVLLASSNENGNVYIETSSIDGETNLKMRNSPDLALTGYVQSKVETLEEAVERIVKISALDKTNIISALENPNNNNTLDTRKTASVEDSYKRSIRQQLLAASKRLLSVGQNIVRDETEERYVAVLTSELPNASVNTFSGKLTLPPLESGNPSIDLPLGAENLLLRGAVLRNTEWAIGVTCFTGADTKLVRNAVETPSKLSQLDRLVNMTIIYIFFVMLILCFVLAALSTYQHRTALDLIWYLGYKKDKTQSWPYLPDLPPPKWDTEPPSMWQVFLTFITLNNGFIPLSLYISLEVLTAYHMRIIRNDKDMYHEKTDLTAVARSTNVSDLGQIKYIFSDKTGTLTQNIMSFKRCTVDGIAFGSPISKEKKSEANSSDNKDTFSAPQPLHQLLAETTLSDKKRGKLSFNAEMLLRVMSLCHTVVVEKDYDSNTKEIDVAQTSRSSFCNPLKKRATKNKRELESKNSGEDPTSVAPKKESVALPNDTISNEKNKDGAPIGFAYQAESPDEGALVSAASLVYGFQLLGRESNGIKLVCSSPTLLEDKTFTNDLKTGKITPNGAASLTGLQERAIYEEAEKNPLSREELWIVLAVNKFDSDRKRMSILVRSPPEFGSIPILLCKGADSSMLNDSVCEGANMLIGREDDTHDKLSRSIDISFAGNEAGFQVEDKDWHMDVLLGLQSHLGDFAGEGLRTLVLGIRILTEIECENWLNRHKEAASAMKNRNELLKEVAIEIETKIHIVGATAIEDELQDGVPETISKLAEGGIKLWVCTGDKRETAIEIGYSTKVLTPSMRLIEIVESSSQNVKYLIAREFMKLIKNGALPLYQKAALEKAKNSKIRLLSKYWRPVGWALGILWGAISYVIKLIFETIFYIIFGTAQFSEREQKASKDRKPNDPYVSRLAVRQLAESIIEVQRNEKMSSLRSDNTGEASQSISFDNDEFEAKPGIFHRAASAKAIRKMRSSSKEFDAKGSKKDDIVNRSSLVLNEVSPSCRLFLPKKKTILEKLFAVDGDVKLGRLKKHLNPNYVSQPRQKVEASSSALVIEGGALLHLLGDPIMEEMLFSVASNCDSVIGCRVSPKQKALLVNLVRNYVSPEPITLAIGDGANDVGMIQEAHVGIGVSGLEGQQAVNASDFAIAQFRYLQELLLIHGRWSFMRMSKLILFTFYKNALLIGTLSYFCTYTLFSGTSMYDQWVISMLNFVASIPIVLTSCFDRDLEKDYVRKNPYVYASGPNNEFLNMRLIIRWILAVLIHTVGICYLGLGPQALGGGQTSAFLGLMQGRDPNYPGEGEGGDLKSVGVTMFTILILTLAYKCTFETRLIVIGEWPFACTCRKDKGEGWNSRISYTIYGTVVFSILFWIGAIYLYSFVARISSNQEYLPMSFVPEHVFSLRAMSWLLIFLVPLPAFGFDMALKLFSNMYFPTQTQIHMEIEHMQENGNLSHEAILT